VLFTIHAWHIHHELARNVEVQQRPTLFRAELRKQLIYFAGRPPSVAVVLSHPDDKIPDDIRLGNVSIRLWCGRNFIVTSASQFDQS
jgi:hypothetical protein